MEVFRGKVSDELLDEYKDIDAERIAIDEIVQSLATRGKVVAQRKQAFWKKVEAELSLKPPGTARICPRTGEIYQEVE